MLWCAPGPVRRQKELGSVWAEAFIGVSIVGKGRQAE